MNARSGLFVGRHPELGEMFACWDASVRFTEGGVRPSKFEARLAPFKSLEAARTALEAAGAAIEAGD